MSTANYTVKTIDVDGAQPARRYKTLEGAKKYFESMYGHSMEVAISEMGRYCDLAVKPTIRAVESIRAVSDFGCVIIFKRHCEAEPEPVVVEADDDDDRDPLKEMDDEEYFDEMRRRERLNPTSCDDPRFDIPF